MYAWALPHAREWEVVAGCGKGVGGCGKVRQVLAGCGRVCVNYVVVVGEVEGVDVPKHGDVLLGGSTQTTHACDHGVNMA